MKVIINEPLSIVDYTGSLANLTINKWYTVNNEKTTSFNNYRIKYNKFIPGTIVVMADNGKWVFLEREEYKTKQEIREEKLLQLGIIYYKH